jgi:hypothetical protein
MKTTQRPSYAPRAAATRTLSRVALLCCLATTASAAGSAIFRDAEHTATITMDGKNLKLQSPEGGCTMLDGECVGQSLAEKLDALIAVNTEKLDKLAEKLDDLVSLEHKAALHVITTQRVVATKEVADLMGSKGSMDSAPWTLGISPNTTYTGGGELLTITGKNFNQASYVWFGTEKQQSIVHVSDTTLHVRAPSHTEGVVDVTVGGSSGYFRTLHSAIDFTLKSTSPPDVRFATSSKSSHATNDNRGHIGGGYEIEILGAGFADGGPNEVEFISSAKDMDGTIPSDEHLKAEAVVTLDDYMLKVRMPKFKRIGWVDVVVRNSKGESTLRRGFDITQEDSGRNSHDLYIDRSVGLDGIATFSGGAEDGAWVGIMLPTGHTVDASYVTSVHINDIDIAQADIRADATKNVIYFRPGKRPANMLGYNAVSAVHGPHHFFHKKALLITEPAGPGSLGDYKVIDNMAAGLNLRLYPVTRRRRRTCYTSSHTQYQHGQNKHVLHKGTDCECAYRLQGTRHYSYKGPAPERASSACINKVGECRQCMLPNEERSEYAFRTLKAGDTSFTLPMFASNEPDNAGHQPSEDNDFEFLGKAGRPFKITAPDGTPCKTANQGCISSPAAKRLSTPDEVFPGTELLFWNEGGQYARATVDAVKPNTADNKDEWSPGDTTIVFKVPFACEGGGECSFGKRSWVNVVPQFKQLTVPKGAVLTAPQGVCTTRRNCAVQKSVGGGYGVGLRGVGCDLGPLPTAPCVNQPSLLALDVDGPLRVDGSIDMTGTALCGKGGSGGGLIVIDAKSVSGSGAITSKGDPGWGTIEITHVAGTTNDGSASGRCDNLSNAAYCGHDHSYEAAHRPNQSRAKLSYTYSQAVTVSSITLKQHANGISEWTRPLCIPPPFRLTVPRCILPPQTASTPTSTTSPSASPAPTAASAAARSTARPPSPPSAASTRPSAARCCASRSPTRPWPTAGPFTPSCPPSRPLRWRPTRATSTPAASPAMALAKTAAATSFSFLRR